MESLWSDIALYERRVLVRDLAIDLQRIPELMLIITERVDAKSLLENNSLARKLDANRQKPDNTLAFYRFMYGYFRSRIRRRE